jgi:hypothetical protein
MLIQRHPMRLAAISSFLEPFPALSDHGLDGVYFVNGAEALEVRGPVVRWPHAHSTGTVGTIQRDARTLTLDYGHTTQKITYAVLNGTLWVGVMRRDPGSPTLWHSLNTLPHSNLTPFGQGPKEATWDEATGDWTFGVSASPTGIATACPGSLCPTPLSAAFQITGDVMLTPWSKSLGKIGLISQPSLSGSILGRWSEDGSEERGMVELVAGPVRRSTAYASPEPTRITVPPDTGVFVADWGQHCMQDHLDVPAIATYVVLSSNRILKRVRLDNHRTAGVVLKDVLLQPVK